MCEQVEEGAEKAMMGQSHPDDVRVTAGLLAVVLLIRKAGEFYRAETSLAEHMGMRAPEDYLTRCEALYTNTYGEQAKRVGLALNRITFEGIIRIEVPNEVLHTTYESLAHTWIFNPYRGWRRV